jgi:integrase
MLDLGLRGDEVTHLTLQSVDWRSATLILSNTKSKRAQRMPLPAATGEIIARYLHDARPQTADRHLFVRHRAPVGKPLEPAAMGRKAWLFAGSELAGQRAAVIMSLVQSAKMNGHDPWAYLKDVLTRLPNHMNSRIDELLPHRWQPLG